MRKFEQVLEQVLKEMDGTHIKAPTRSFRRAGLNMGVGRRFGGPPEVRKEKKESK